MIQIPLTNQPNQSFNCTIPQGSSNITLAFYVYWNRIANYWQMSITNVASRIELLDGLPMVTGRSPDQNLLQQWAYMNIGQAYVVPLTSTAPDYPGENDWGTNFGLFWGP